MLAINFVSVFESHTKNSWQKQKTGFSLFIGDVLWIQCETVFS